MARDLRDIQDRFHRSLATVIIGKLAEAREQLENGMPLDQYQKAVGRIGALKDVLEWSDDIEKDQYGPKPG
jgi:hypothetical protein